MNLISSSTGERIEGWEIQVSNSVVDVLLLSLSPHLPGGKKRGKKKQLRPVCMYSEEGQKGRYSSILNIERGLLGGLRGQERN